MLVLGRKPGEYIVINEKIIVKVIKSEEGHLRLAIDAPQDIIHDTSTEHRVVIISAQILATIHCS